MSVIKIRNAADDDWLVLGGTVDPVAIHNNVAGEIVVITEKTAPVDDDEIIIEDSEASNVKKSVKLGNIAPKYPYSHKKDLEITYGSYYTGTVTCDELVLRDTNDNTILIENVSEVINLTVSGTNGLDTGSEAASTWYYQWIIYKPSTQNVSAIFSLSASSPTMPAGYTYKRLVGEMYNDASSNLVFGRRLDDWYWFYDDQVVYSAHTLTTAFVAKTLPVAVPAGADQLLVTTGCSVSGTRNMQVLSLHSGANYNQRVFSSYVSAWANNHPAWYYIVSGLIFTIKDNTTIYAKTHYTASYTNQALTIWGYRLAR